MKNLTWILAVLILAFVGDRAGAWLLGTITQQSQFRYSRLYNGAAACDVLLIGNSRGLIFYQPYIEEKTGLSTTNISYNGLPMDLASVLVKDFIDKNGAPKLLLVDVTMLDKRMDERLLTGFNLYVPDSDRLSKLMEEKYPTSYFGGQVSNLYRYNSEVFQRALYYWNRSDKDWLLDRVISPTMQANAAYLDSFDYDYSPEMLNDLADLLQFTEGKNIKVELVINPYYPPFAEKIGNLGTLKEAIKNATQKEVLDYSNSIQGVEGFGDYQHLNKTGAKAYLDMLIEDGVLDY